MTDNNSRKPTPATARTARATAATTARKKVAIVLSSGGARGYAHIGAIEALTERGYEITSVAGTSMGALIGGMYATGRLADIRDWMTSLDRRNVRQLIDFSLGMNHLVKGEKVIEAMKKIVPDVRIEDLPTPFCAVATDINSGKEVVFSKGSLYAAIRASISVPTLFQPVSHDDMLLIDGGITNGLPLNRVRRSEGDLLVAVNVTAPYQFREKLKRQPVHPQGFAGKAISAFNKTLGQNNFYTLVSSSISVLIQRNIELCLRLDPPDILVEMAADRFSSYDYDKAEKIIRKGRQQMLRAIDDYERRCTQQQPAPPRQGWLHGWLSRFLP